MRKSVRQAAIPAVLALVLLSCAEQATEGAKLAAGQKLQITQKVWSDYQEYLQKGQGLGPDRQDAFGVALVGDIRTVGLYNAYPGVPGNHHI
jgi:hypothetical protein